MKQHILADLPAMLLASVEAGAFGFAVVWAGVFSIVTNEWAIRIALAGGVLAMIATAWAVVVLSRRRAAMEAAAAAEEG